MIQFPSCKINLGLDILQKRTDGFHEIETAMLEISSQQRVPSGAGPTTLGGSLNDILEVVPADSFSFHASGLAIPGDSNSCIDAFRLLKDRHGIPDVALYLHKNVPMGGGLGGGSADAAQTLVALNRLFEIGLTEDQLESYAVELGSDCPFFIRGGLQLAMGRGEVLRRLDIVLPELHIVLVNLGIHVPTATAYSKVIPFSDRPSVESVLRKPVQFWKEELVNDFEKSVFAEHPVLGEVKEALYNAGAVYAAMTGSGSTMYGMFEEKPDLIQWPKKPVMEVWV